MRFLIAIALGIALCSCKANATATLNFGSLMLQSGAPLTIFDNSTPATPVVTDSSVSLGVEFTSTEPGQIQGVRFYRGATDSSGYKVALYTNSGAQLAAASTAADTCSVPCWESVNFSSPPSVSANTTYVAAYLANNGNYAVTNNGLTSSVTNGPLTALASGGVYTYGSTLTFPSSVFMASNYFVDVLFVPGGVGPQTISSVNLSNSSFVGGSPSGTIVGAISVTMAPTSPTFSGTLSLSGTNASDFQIVGGNLETNGVVAAGTYNFNIVATQAGIGNSPFVQPDPLIVPARVKGNLTK